MQNSLLNKVLGVLIVALILVGVWYFFMMRVVEDVSESSADDSPPTLLQDEIDAIVGADDFEGLAIGKLAPDFELELFNDEGKIRLSDFRGKKAVVLNFWASWCTYCTIEMPLLEKFHQDFADDAVVIGVNLQESYLDVLRGYVEGIGVTYALALDPDAKAKKAFRVVVQPQTFFLDKEGILRDVHYGPFGVKELLKKAEKIGVRL